MLSLHDLQRKSVRDVRPGFLVLYRHGPSWLRALRVVEPGGPGDEEDAEERQALVVMPLETRNGGTSPFLFGEVGHENCLVLGKARAWWSGDPSVIVPASEVDRRPGYLQLRPEGVTIITAINRPHSNTYAWRISDGQAAKVSTEYPLITQWCLGIEGAEGKPVPFVRYPQDFADN